jgi:hypothetical protein
MRTSVLITIVLLALARPAFAQGTGPIAAYHFNNGSGETATDATGNGHDGIITGANWTEAGRYGGALVFDGMDDWVTVAEHPALNLTTGMTVEAWVYPTQPMTGYSTVALREVPGGLSYALYAHDASPEPAAWIKANGFDVEALGTAPLPLNLWTHLAATYDGETLRLFVNGVPAASYAVSGAMSDLGGVLRFGGNAVWGEYFAGRLDEIRIYDRALSDSEIQADAATPIGVLPGLDTTPPTVSLTSPTNGIVSGTVTVKASASDNDGIDGVQFRINGSNFGPKDVQPPFEIDWTTTAVPNGVYRLTAVAIDRVGNTRESDPVDVTVFNTPGGSVGGAWSAPFDLGVTAVNMVLLNTGKVLMYAGETIGGSSATLYDPTTGALKAVPASDNLYGSAHAQLADGRILVAGGHDSDNSVLGGAFANIFDPVTESWQPGIPRMAQRRWNPTTTTLGNGRIVVTSGATTCPTCIADVPEVYAPDTNEWTQMTAAALSYPYNPFTFLLPSGRLLNAGSSMEPDYTRALDVNSQTWNVVDGWVVDGGSAAMYRPGRIMKSGSAANGSDSGPAAATTYVMDANASSPTWRQTAPMAFPRAFHNLVLLPDGDVLAVGGELSRDGSDLSQSVLAGEIWSPATETWRTVAWMQRGRLHQSTALLLPDARVLVAGSGSDYGEGFDDTTAEIYSPPYLFNGPRPVINEVEPNIRYGSIFPVVTTPDGSTRSVVLIRLGATTHQFDMDQRYLELPFFYGEGGLIVMAPASVNEAPPGYYMLFLVNTAGVPSVAKIVRLLSPFDTTPPSAPTALTASVIASTVNLRWAGSVDDTAVAHYNIYRSTTPGFVPAPVNWRARTTGTSYSDLGLGNGIYYYVVTAADLVGNVSGPSNEATATLAQDIFAPVVDVTYPSSFATVTGSGVLAAVASDDVGVTNVQFLIDGVVVGGDDSPPYAIIWDSSTVADGMHMLTARAFDGSGKSGVSGQVAIITLNGTSTPTGLVAAYNFNQGTGTMVPDASGTGNDGTISGAAWSVLGKYGGALSFDGVSSRIDIADADSLDLTTAFTLEAWVYPTATSGWRTVILKEQPDNFTYALYARGDADVPSGWANMSGIQHAVEGTSALPLHTWTHVVTTFDGSMLQLYVNGVLVREFGLSRAAATVSSGDLRIGGNAIWDEYFKGRIDEVRIYNRALSPAEIQVNMGTPVP